MIIGRAMKKNNGHCSVHTFTIHKCCFYKVLNTTFSLHFKILEKRKMYLIPFLNFIERGFFSRFLFFYKTYNQAFFPNLFLCADKTYAQGFYKIQFYAQTKHMPRLFLNSISMLRQNICPGFFFKFHFYSQTKHMPRVFFEFDFYAQTKHMPRVFFKIPFL